MEAALGRETDALALFASLAEAPYRYDFYQTLRRLECLFAEKPRWGTALRPADEPVRLGRIPICPSRPRRWRRSKEGKGRCRRGSR
jgi:type VI secretion system protein ImpH